MNVEQLSIFLENKAGRLAEVTRVLAEADINIKALSLADTSEFGILRMIVDDQDKAKAVLKASGVTVGLTSVAAVKVPHKPGGLNSILQLMGGHGVNVEYMYAFLQKDGDAVMIFRFDNMDAALEILKQTKLPVLTSQQICRA